MPGENMEERIKELLQMGLEKTEIARRLGVSRKTLYKHLGRMRQNSDDLLPGDQSASPGRTHSGQWAAGNPGGPGAPIGNKNGLVTGEYETLWDSGLSDREQRAFREAWKLPTLEQINRQIGLLDVRIGRTLERLRQYREALATGIEMQLDGRSQTDGTIMGQDMNTTTDRFVHTREIVDRSEKAIDRMLQRRERLLTMRATIELHLLRRGLSDGPGGQQQERTQRRNLSLLSDEELNNLESILSRVALS